MKKVDMILMSCSKEVSLDQISGIIGWKKGPTSTAINHLIKRGFLKKTRYGFYIATKDGKKRIKEIIEDEDPHRGIDSVVYRTAALFTTDARFDIIRTVKFEMQSRKPTGKTRELGDIIRNIYLETLSPINFKHGGDDYVKSVWRYHEKPVCECGFNYERAYKNHAEEIKEFAEKTQLAKKLDKEKIFRNLRWESFTDIDKYRRMLGLPLSFPRLDIPES